ncbi:hypothetical protein Dsin_026248 [Dipteronia sinensis]|uniref:D-isomer specific 2-hydroxyacid dehydrogenase NAD-binding domain-containing protein n=1 Tax=Dipteronia sinensis TaxID=43782 RepID=A0AAD9ZYW9_9ROSI|nr:hypothetical protein Dsin_026248 [Dipteronia sinensis]
MSRGDYALGSKELVRCLVQGEIGSAGLDVFENEPNVPQELFAMDNVVMSPHNAVFTTESFMALCEIVVGNFEAFFTNKPLCQLLPEGFRTMELEKSRVTNSNKGSVNVSTMRHIARSEHGKLSKIGQNMWWKAWKLSSQKKPHTLSGCGLWMIKWISAWMLISPLFYKFWSQSSVLAALNIFISNAKYHSSRINF